MVLDPRSLLITPGDLPSNQGPGSAETVDDTGQTRVARHAPASWKDVPWRSIIGAVFVVLITIILVAVVLATIRIITWVVIAGFFAVVLAPAVAACRHGRRPTRLGDGLRRVRDADRSSLGLLALFILPVRTQLVAIVTDLPGTVQRAADGRGADR